MGSRRHDGLRNPAQEEQAEQRRDRPGSQHDDVAAGAGVEPRSQLVDGESRHQAQNSTNRGCNRHPPREGPRSHILRQEIADPGIPRRT